MSPEDKLFSKGYVIRIKFTQLLYYCKLTRWALSCARVAVEQAGTRALGTVASIRQCDE